jgi:hypothetical protein
MRIFAVTGTGAHARTTERAIFSKSGQQRGTTVFRDDLVHRAAEIQVDEIRLFPVDDHARRLAEMLRVRAEKLHTQRALRLLKFEILQRAFVAPKNALGADEFRDHHIRAVLFRELPEHGVRDPGHGREVERETVLKPRRHAARKIPDARCASTASAPRLDPPPAAPRDSAPR